MGMIYGPRRFGEYDRNTEAALLKRIVAPGGTFVGLDTALRSTSWDGDGYSTTAKTLLDLSAVFGAPAGIKAVLVGVRLRDSSATGGEFFLILGPDATANAGLFEYADGGDRWTATTMTVPCDDNGDIYYQIYASGAGTLDVDLAIWGYFI